MWYSSLNMLDVLPIAYTEMWTCHEQKALPGTLTCKVTSTIKFKT